jgi:hypothetical protein
MFVGVPGCCRARVNSCVKEQVTNRGKAYMWAVAGRCPTCRAFSITIVLSLLKGILPIALYLTKRLYEGSIVFVQSIFRFSISGDNGTVILSTCDN